LANFSSLENTFDYFRFVRKKDIRISLKGAYAVIYMNFDCIKQTNLLNI